MSVSRSRALTMLKDTYNHRGKEPLKIEKALASCLYYRCISLYEHIMMFHYLRDTR